jgi:hypothetical protein
MVRSVLVGAFMLMEGVASAQETTAGGAGLTVAPAGFGSITIRENQRRFEGSATLRVAESVRVTARVGAPLDTDTRRAALARPTGGLVSGFSAGIEFAYDETAVAVTEQERRMGAEICPALIAEYERRAATEILGQIDRLIASNHPQDESPLVLPAMVSALRSQADVYRAIATNPESADGAMRSRLAALPDPEASQQEHESSELTTIRTSHQRFMSHPPICNPMSPGGLLNELESTRLSVGNEGRLLRQSVARRLSLGLAPGESRVRHVGGLTLDGTYDRPSVHVGGVPSPTATGALPSPANLDSWRLQIGGVWRIYFGERNMLSVRAGLSLAESVSPLTAQVCIPIDPAATGTFSTRCSEVKYVNSAPERQTAVFARLGYAHLFGRVIDGALPGFEVRAAFEALTAADPHFVAGASVFMMPAINTTFTRFGFGVDLTVPLTGSDQSVTAVPYAFVGVTP